MEVTKQQQNATRNIVSITVYSDIKQHRFTPSDKTPQLYGLYRIKNKCSISSLKVTGLEFKEEQKAEISDK